MNRNMTVTRTISAGNCVSSARTFSTPGAPELQTARRHSSAGIRALKWATASARSLGSSLGSESRASKDNLFSIVVTPDSIPQFTIPSLAVQDNLRCFGKERERQSDEADGGAAEEGWGSIDDEMESLSVQMMSTSLSSSASSSCSGFGSSPPIGRRAHRSISDPSNHKLPHFQHESSYPSCSFLEAQDFPDPATRAALSLPHLPKVTTPYGFVTLSQSPQMASEEALFFQAGHRRWNKDEEGMLIRNPILDVNKNPSSQTHLAYTPSSASCQPPLVQRLSAKEHSISQTVATSSPIKVPGSQPKSRFWGVLRKHFTGLREMK